VPALSRGVRTALPLAAGGSLVTFGIPPRGPVTGYGYIETRRPGREASAAFACGASSRNRSRDARRYFSSDRFFWNSGMFALRPKGFLEELRASARRF